LVQWHTVGNNSWAPWIWSWQYGGAIPASALDEMNGSCAGFIGDLEQRCLVDRSSEHWLSWYAVMVIAGYRHD
jgi:hypothetical protein